MTIMKHVTGLTIPLGPSTPIYPGDPIPEIDLLSSLDNGDIVTASKINLGVHIGTHVDLPAHFLTDAQTLGAYPIDAFVGSAGVLDLTDVERSICLSRLQKETILENQHILLKTKNSNKLQQPEFFEDYVFIEPDATQFLLDKNPLSLGIDYYSLDPSDSEQFPSHKLCARRGVPVFVCLDLSQTEASVNYQFAGLPLNFPALEGVPVRAIVWTD